MKIFVALIFLLAAANAVAQVTDTLISKGMEPAAMQEDFKYLVRLLKETHPGLYRYNTPEIMQAKMDSCEALLNHPMGFYDFYRIIESLVADIHCAHSYSLPVKDFQHYFNSGIKTIPFFMFPVRGKLYVLFNCTPDQSVLPGFELLAINGQSTEEIKKMVKRFYWADGHIELSKNAALQGQLFDFFYYAFVARPDSFKLTFKNLSGDTIMIQTAAQTFASYSKWIKENTVNKKMNEWYNKQKNKEPWRLSFLQDVKETAFLRFDGFGGTGQNSEAEARTAFKKFMDKAMTAIQKAGCKNLVVDVRSNGGGWDNQGVELFTYLMKSDTAVRYYRRKHAITDGSDFLKYSDLSADDLKNVKRELIPENDGSFTLREDKSPDLQLQYPKPNRFRGKLYILMDEKTFSTASEFTAAAKHNKLGIMIGEETPGAYDGGNGSSFIHLQLPKSGIAIATPLVYYQMNVAETKDRGRGTIPDYQVSVMIEDVLNHVDTQLEFVKHLIGK